MKKDNFNLEQFIIQFYLFGLTSGEYLKKENPEINLLNCYTKIEIPDIKIEERYSLGIKFINSSNIPSYSILLSPTSRQGVYYFEEKPQQKLRICGYNKDINSSVFFDNLELIEKENINLCNNLENKIREGKIEINC